MLALTFKVSESAVMVLEDGKEIWLSYIRQSGDSAIIELMGKVHSLKPLGTINVVLPDDRIIKVTYVTQHGRAIVIGFAAPRSIKIYREKVWHQLQLSRQP